MDQRRSHHRATSSRMAVFLACGALLGSASAATAASRPSHTPAGNGAVVLAPAGGTFDLPGIGGVFGTLGYGQTDASRNDGLRVTSSGVWNAGGSSASGAPVLYVEIELSGVRAISFASDAAAREAVPRDAVVRAPQLVDGVRYTVYLFAGNRPVGPSYDAGTSSSSTLSFASPLHGISLAPGRPLVIELVPEFRRAPPPAPTPASTSVPLQSAGGSVPVLQFGGYHGALAYASNNAVGSVLLTMTNSGGRNIDHAPPPASGSAALYLEASVSGGASVAFGPASATATLDAPGLVNGENYGVFVFAGGQPVGKPYYAGQPSKHSLTFGTPLANLGITPGTPLVIELSKGAFAPSVTQYNVPAGGGIVTGPDGALWFTEGAASAIGRLTTSGSLTSYPTPTANAGPFEIAVGPDNAVWFTELSVGAVGRIDMSGHIKEYSLGPSNPNGIAAGPDGNLWVADYDGNGIWRVSTSGHARKFRTSSRAFPIGIAAGPDGAMWFTEFGGWIGRITTSGAITNYRIKTRSSRPYSIAQGPDNAMWFTEAGSSKIGRIDMSAAITDYSLKAPSSDPISIAQGPDGAMWFTEYEGQVVGRITTYGAIARFQLPNGAFPYFITRGPDNAMWFTQESSPSTVTRISVPGVSNARPRK